MPHASAHSGKVAALDDLATSPALKAVQASLIDDDVLFDSPRGPRRLIYADWTASSRPCDLVESSLRRIAHPLFGNTHAESSAVGIATGQLRERARDQVKDAVGAKGDDDLKVIFTGSGTTGAISRLIAMLGLGRRRDAASSPWSPTPSSTRGDQDDDDDRPVVFIGPYEHHSNEISWRETDAELVVIPEDSLGRVDLAALESALSRFDHGGAKKRKRLKIGAFSAASNVTGVLTDLEALSDILRRHGALRCFDCAALGPHARLDAANADALFVSPHKFVGGPGTPGVLVVRASIVPRAPPASSSPTSTSTQTPLLPPDVPGGGTVSFVTAQDHSYLDDIVAREEGGTPDILGSIRAGLVFDLQRHVGYDLIAQREHAFLGAALEAWSKVDNLVILGNTSIDRAATVSFCVRAPPEAGCSRRGMQMQVHHNLVVAILSDVFGIQARGGCSCAGPYGARLLGISTEQQEALKRLVVRGGAEGIKPGWTRVSFSYTDSPDKVRAIIHAVTFVARHAASLIKLYSFDVRSGRFVFENGGAPLPRSRGGFLSSLKLAKRQPAPIDARWPSAAELLSSTGARAARDTRSLKQSFRLALRDAQSLVDHLPPYSVSTATLEDEECERERWFILP